MDEYPTITIQSGTFNSNVKLWHKVLDSVKMQDYPKSKIEHIVFDKGSTNGCDKLAKKYGCHVIVRNDPFDKAQMSAAIGTQMAKGQLVLVLESDNILTSKNWLRQMVQPFIDNKRIVCTFSIHQNFEKGMNATTRYCALLGSPDPTLYYLKKTEKVRMDQKHYDRGEIMKETKNYYVVRFDKTNLPTLGDNGHMFRKGPMLRVISDPGRYTHTDAFADLVANGYDTFGAVKNSVIHTMNPSLVYLVGARVRIKSIYTDGRRGKRSYLVFNPKSWRDKIRIFLFIVYSFTFIQPLFVSIRGYIHVRDVAWFLHPIFCVMMVIGYGYSELSYKLKRIVRVYLT